MKKLIEEAIRNADVKQIMEKHKKCKMGSNMIDAKIGIRRCKNMVYYDKHGLLLSYNDYVAVETKDIGIHKGYIRCFNNGNVKVGCLVGELRVPANKVSKQ